MSGSVPAWRRQGYSIDAMRDLARGALPRPIFDFADGAAEDEHTLRRNENAFDEIELVPRPLRAQVASSHQSRAAHARRPKRRSRR